MDLEEQLSEWQKDKKKLLELLGHDDILKELIRYLANRKDFAKAVKEASKWWK